MFPETLTSKTEKVITHVKRRRTRYATAVGFIAGAYVTRKLDSNTYHEAMAFLKEKELYDEFFALSEEL